MEENKKNKIPNVPNLGFGIETNEIINLKRLISIRMGQSPDSASYNEEGIGLPLIQGNADIKDGFSAPKRYTSKPTKICDAGDILLTVRAPVGDVSIASEISCIGRGVCSIKAEKYIYYFLQSKEKHWKKIAQGSTFICISSDDITKLQCNWPNQNTRKKTELFLTIIDERIKTQNKIIDKYKSLIKSICDNTSVIDNNYLKDIAKYNSSNIKESDVKSEGNYPVFGASGLCGFLNDYSFSKAGIAIIKDGAGVGRLLKIMDEKYSILGTMGLIEPKEGVTQEFLWLALKKVRFEKYTIGSGIPHIYFNDYSNSLIPSSSIENKKKANLCALLEDKIKIEEKILNSFLKQKKYLLSNLFI